MCLYQPRFIPAHLINITNIKNFKSTTKSKSAKDLQLTEEHQKPNRLQTEFVSTLSFLAQKN